jgi:general L-amino acid transport system permease protein
MQIKPEFIALYLALSFYTASFHRRDRARRHPRRAERPVRGVLRARSALGPGAAPRVIPQALRIIIPPLTSQYLNLTKNSSLAIAVGLRRPRCHRRHDPQPDRPVDRDRVPSGWWSIWG